MVADLVRDWRSPPVVIDMFSRRIVGRPARRNQSPTDCRSKGWRWPQWTRERAGQTGDSGGLRQLVTAPGQTKSTPARGAGNLIRLPPLH